MSPASEPVDVAIVGGGPAGTSAALSLADRADLSVAIFEATDYGDRRVGEVLTPRAVEALRELGADRDFLEQGHMQSPGFCSSWQDEQIGYFDMITHPMGSAWNIDRRRFDAGLARVASERGISVYRRHRVADCRIAGDDRIGLTGSGPNGQQFHCRARFVIDASGRGARLARRIGARRCAVDRLVAFCGYFGSPASSRMTRIEATRDGWWYLASLPRDKCLAGFLTDADIAHANGVRRDDQWSTGLKATQHIYDSIVQPAKPEGAVRVVAAQSSILRPAQGPGWLAVGDAALSIDPLSSQGILAALRSGIAAGQYVADQFAGARTGAKSRQAVLEQRFEAYLAARAEYYRKVQRWPEAPFWTRRHSAPKIPPFVRLGR